MALQVKLTVSQKRTDRLNCFLHAGTNLGKVKVDLMILEWAWSKITNFFLVHDTLKSAVSEE